MVRPTRDPIGGEHAVELDETLVGGRTRGEGRGKHHKVYVIAAVEARFRKSGEDRSAAGERDDHRDGRPLKQRVYAGRLRMKVVSDRKAATCERFARENVLTASVIRTDGWQGYDKLRALGYDHHPLAMDADHELEDEHLPMVHLVFSNFKTWLLGTHHGVSQQHLQAYCNEYTFRFNRRFYPATTFNSLLGLAAKTVPPTTRRSTPASGSILGRRRCRRRSRSRSHETVDRNGIEDGSQALGVDDDARPRLREHPAGNERLRCGCQFDAHARCADLRLRLRHVSPQDGDLVSSGGRRGGAARHAFEPDAGREEGGAGTAVEAVRQSRERGP